MIKCAHECNYCRMRNVMINDCTVETHCLRRKQIETLDRVIKCQETINLRIEFAKDLVLVLVTNKQEDMSDDIVMSFAEGIIRHRENDKEDKFEENQHYAGMQELFCGHAVKD